MGACWSNRIKTESPIHRGVNPTNGSDTSSPLPPTRRSEGEILQAFILKRFTYNELRMATRDFSADSLLGQGCFGCVFKGWVDEHSFTPTETGTGLATAVKRLNKNGSRGHMEWLTEINYLGQLHHRNLVKLIGYCLEGDHRLLVYEFMPQGSVENYLFKKESYFQPLSWDIRVKIALGAARGLAFLHMSESRVIYRDFKPSDILLDVDYNAKLSDFGLARDGPTGDKTHVSTKVRGTSDYAAPEYLATGHLTSKCDVYSFGVVLLELLSGKRAVDKDRPLGEQILVDWVKPYLTHKHKIFRVLDPRLEGKYSLGQALAVAKLALQCLSTYPKLRPTMDEVVTTLESLQDSADTVKGAHEERRTRLFQCLNKKTLQRKLL